MSLRRRESNSIVSHQEKNTQFHLIGIEGLIRGVEKVAHERKRHSLFVLKMQKELLEGNATKEAADWDVLLAAAATRHSLKASKMARLRASLAE